MRLYKIFAHRFKCRIKGYIYLLVKRQDSEAENPFSNKASVWNSWIFLYISLYFYLEAQANKKVVHIVLKFKMAACIHLEAKV
jgi:hypothetical protein